MKGDGDSRPFTQLRKYAQDFLESLYPPVPEGKVKDNGQYFSGCSCIIRERMAEALAHVGYASRLNIALIVPMDVLEMHKDFEISKMAGLIYPLLSKPCGEGRRQH